MFSLYPRFGYDASEEFRLSLYFEDFAEGAEHVTRGRTITESDIMNFAGLTGDYIELHTNEEYARQGPFGRRIAHGMLTLSVSVGLMTRMNLINDTVVAFYGIDKLRFVKPVFIGDTIYVKKKVAEAIAKGPAGMITFDTTVVNQSGEPVLVYRDKLAIKRRPEGSSA
jgi:3-hydroxybutyryl-CoA dehydratase